MNSGVIRVIVEVLLDGSFSISNVIGQVLPCEPLIGSHSFRDAIFVAPPNCTNCKRDDGGVQILYSLGSHILDLRNTELFQCRECNKKFKTKKSLSHHLNTHTSRFQCKICNKRFESNAVLTQHMKKHQPPNTGFNYKCEYHTANSEDCHFVTKTKSTLVKHREMMHQSKNKKQCGIDGCNDKTAKCEHVFKEDPGWPIIPISPRRKCIDWSKC